MSDRFAEARALFLRQQAQGQFPGGQLVVRRGGAVLLDIAVGLASGVRDGEPRREVTPETCFQVMSASKAVVALAIAQLEDRGRLDPAAPIVEIWPEFGANGKRDVTVLDVLTHRSGMVGVERVLAPERWSDWDALMAAIAALAPSYPRGVLAYNAVGYGWILAEVVRRVTGMTLPAWLRANLPVALHGLQLLLADGAPRARTYWLGAARHEVGGVDIAGTFEHVNNEISARAALVPGAGMYTTARDLALFYEALAAGGVMPTGERLVSAEVLARYTTPQVRGWDRSVRTLVVLGRGFSCGWRWPHPYGWWGTSACFGHPGGFGVTAWGDRETASGIAMVTNGNRSVADLVRRSAPLGSAIRRALRRG